MVWLAKQVYDRLEKYEINKTLDDVTKTVPEHEKKAYSRSAENLIGFDASKSFRQARLIYKLTPSTLGDKEIFDFPNNHCPFLGMDIEKKHHMVFSSRDKELAVFGVNVKLVLGMYMMGSILYKKGAFMDLIEWKVQEKLLTSEQGQLIRQVIKGDDKS